MSPGEQGGPGAVGFGLQVDTSLARARYDEKGTKRGEGAEDVVCF